MQNEKPHQVKKVEPKGGESSGKKVKMSYYLSSNPQNTLEVFDATKIERETLI